MPWVAAAVVASGALAGCRRESNLLTDYPPRTHVRWTERTTTAAGAVSEEPMEEVWQRVPGATPTWLVTTTTRPGASDARALVARYELRAEGLVCSGTSAAGEPAEITPVKRVLPADPRPGAAWRATHRVRGRDVQRACALAAWPSCAGGLELSCTVEDQDTTTVVRSYYCRGTGIAAYEARTTRGGVTTVVESRGLVSVAP